MPTLLVVHHTPSPALHDLLEQVRAGASDPQITGVDLRVRPALVASALDVLESDAVILGTPANLGWMSGALKHFFDQAYYPCLDATVGRPYGMYVHGNDDTTGARRSIERIVTGLRWTLAAAPVEVVGAPDRAAREACWDLGATLAATIAVDADDRGER